MVKVKWMDEPSFVVLSISCSVITETSSSLSLGTLLQDNGSKGRMIAYGGQSQVMTKKLGGKKWENATTAVSSSTKLYSGPAATKDRTIESLGSIWDKLQSKIAILRDWNGEDWRSKGELKENLVSTWSQLLSPPSLIGEAATDQSVKVPGNTGKNPDPDSTPIVSVLWGKVERGIGINRHKSGRPSNNEAQENISLNELWKKLSQGPANKNGRTYLHLGSEDFSRSEMDDHFQGLGNVSASTCWRNWHGHQVKPGSVMVLGERSRKESINYCSDVSLSGPPSFFSSQPPPNS